MARPFLVDQWRDQRISAFRKSSSLYAHEFTIHGYNIANYITLFDLHGGGRFEMCKNLLMTFVIIERMLPCALLNLFAYVCHSCSDNGGLNVFSRDDVKKLLP